MNYIRAVKEIGDAQVIIKKIKIIYNKSNNNTKH